MTYNDNVSFYNDFLNVFFIMITTIDNCEDFPSQTRTKPVWNLAFCQMTFINIKHQHQGCLGLSGILTLTYALNYLEGTEKKTDAWIHFQRSSFQARSETQPGHWNFLKLYRQSEWAAKNETCYLLQIILYYSE